MVEMPKMTQEMVLDKLKREWDFEQLLEPYRDGGPDKLHKVERSWGTIIDWLINRHKFPADVVGAGIFLVWMHIKANGHFNGDGSWGSAGNQFVHAIKTSCASIMQQQMSQQIFSGMAGEIEQKIKMAYQHDLWRNIPWWVKMFAMNWWKFKSVQRKAKKSEKAKK